jgi:hypothetical protein
VHPREKVSHPEAEMAVPCKTGHEIQSGQSGIKNSLYIPSKMVDKVS